MTQAALLRCPHCGVMNRVAADGQGHRTPVCGKCKAPLPTSAEPVIVTDATFAEQVERSPLPVLLDMWAPWCGPCRMVAPTVDALASELAGRVLVAKMNVDDNPATSARFNVRSIPALLVLKGGREVERMVGVQTKAEILRKLTALMG